MGRLTARETISSTKQNFEALNQKTSPGVLYVEEDTGKMKVGDGSAYNTIKSHSQDSNGGYEFTGGFTDRTTGSSGVNDIGSNVEYTSAMVSANTWYRFGLDSTRQLANDKPYWTNGAGGVDEAPGAIYNADAGNLPSGFTMSGSNAYPDAYQGTGLFSGAYMPEGVSNLFNFTENSSTYNQATTIGGLNTNSATGSFDFTQCNVGDFAKIRFDFNVLPQHANTTVEVGLIWSTRDSNDNITFTFPLLTQPIFYGTGTVGKVYLNRPIITAYFASLEDVNARALLAVKSDNPISIQPLTTLCSIER